jgi:hypothetical protein
MVLIVTGAGIPTPSYAAVPAEAAAGYDTVKNPRDGAA